jgi:hypothetical protein
MPDDYHPPMPRRNPEDIDLGAIKADLEFLIEQVTRFRKEKIAVSCPGCSKSIKRKLHNASEPPRHCRMGADARND